MADIFDLFRAIEKRESPSPITWLVVGLGNPGKDYVNTRHNAGFIAIDYIAEKLGVKINRARFHALTAEAEIAGARVLFMKPETYMNNSGVAVGEAAGFYKIPAERIVVLHDEISFDPGLLRIRRKGSAGGHNGLKSIISAVGDEFPRVKIGVGKKPHPDYDLADWVLGKMSADDIKKLGSRLADIDEATALIVGGKIDDAMAKFSK